MQGLPERTCLMGCTRDTRGNATPVVLNGKLRSEAWSGVFLWIQRVQKLYFS